MTRVRCAIYTRKSSEEGLEQDFNSLDAQHAACVAYVTSQRSEGWTLLPTRYDDGGLSGATLARPALQRLLADIASRQIDVVLVYKVDRLTRSLLDFALLVQAYDKAGTSFVSITQSFNTTTSMGRLTLNMLLSFAQFEREVTAERIRDKIAASKQRGLWMGGTPPLGYRPNGRSLAIVDKHAEIICCIFDRYYAHKRVRSVADELARDGIAIPQRTLGSGRRIGGGPFTTGQLYVILKNPIYAGRIKHGRKVYPGNHPSIIDPTLFDSVQQHLAANTQGHHPEHHAKVSSPLAGKLFDTDDQPLIATHACKKTRDNPDGARVRYRYYVSRELHHGRTTHGMRLPAGEIERVVAEPIAALLGDGPALLDALGPEAVLASDLHTQCNRLATALSTRAREDRQRLLEAFITRVTIAADSITITLDRQALIGALGPSHSATTQQSCTSTDPIVLQTDVQLARRGQNKRLIMLGDPQDITDPDARIVALLTKAHGWKDELMCETDLTVSSLGARHGVTRSYITRLLRLAFLAPDITQALLEGNVPLTITADSLLRRHELPIAWPAQRALLGIVG
jgi:site-specific DNA recombinase